MKSFAVAALVSAVVATPEGLLGGLLGDNKLGNGLLGGNEAPQSQPNNAHSQPNNAQFDNNVQDVTSNRQTQSIFGNDGDHFNIELPAGVSLNADVGPSYPPPVGSINVWHPPHHGIDIDDCDKEDDDDWHYVHPCEDCTTTKTKTHKWTTSTATATLTHTVTDCPATVTDCPLSSVVVTATTTICPVEVTETEAPTITKTLAPTLETITTLPYCDEVTQTIAPPAPTSMPQAPTTTVIQVPSLPSTTVVQKPPTNNNPVKPGNGTQTMPPMVTGAGVRAEAGIFAAVGAAVAFFL